MQPETDRFICHLIQLSQQSYKYSRIYPSPMHMENWSSGTLKYLYICIYIHTQDHIVCWILHFGSRAHTLKHRVTELPSVTRVVVRENLESNWVIIVSEKERVSSSYLHWDQFYLGVFSLILP